MNHCDYLQSIDSQSPININCEQYYLMSCTFCYLSMLWCTRRDGICWLISSAPSAEHGIARSFFLVAGTKQTMAQNSRHKCISLWNSLQLDSFKTSVSAETLLNYHKLDTGKSSVQSIGIRSCSDSMQIVVVAMHGISRSGSACFHLRSLHRLFISGISSIVEYRTMVDLSCWLVK